MAEEGVWRGVISIRSSVGAHSQEERFSLTGVTDRRQSLLSQGWSERDSDGWEDTHDITSVWCDMV